MEQRLKEMRMKIAKNLENKKCIKHLRKMGIKQAT